MTGKFIFGSLLDGTSTTGSTAFQDKGFDPTGWELALVTAPSNTTSSASSSQLVGFFDLHMFFYEFGFYVLVAFMVPRDQNRLGYMGTTLASSALFSWMFQSSC